MHYRPRSLCGLPMINPKNRYYKIWAFLLITIDATYTAFIVPIGVGFRVSDTSWNWIAVIDFLAGAVAGPGVERSTTVPVCPWSLSWHPRTAALSVDTYTTPLEG